MVPDGSRVEWFCDDGPVRWVTVSDPDDHRLDGYRALRHPERRRRVEERDGVFVAEGAAVVGRLARSAYPFVGAAVVPEQRAAVEDQLGGAPVPAGADLLVVPRAVLDAVVGFPVHRGVLGLGRRRPIPGVDSVAGTSRTLVALEECNDNENLGAIARSARALGVDGLVLSPRCADPLYRRSVRVSMGEVLHLDLYRGEPWPDALDALRSQGFRIVALTPAIDAVDLDAVTVAPTDRVALVAGAEGAGLSEAVLAMADIRVRIPIRGEVDSLNVGHALAVACHHVAAARRAARPGPFGEGWEQDPTLSR
jgi:tRNA G18 (ribose-2'-O)-methylase SpoU